MKGSAAHGRSLSRAGRVPAYCARQILSILVPPGVPWLAAGDGVDVAALHDAALLEITDCP